MNIRRNTAGQRVAFYAIDADGDPVTGDAANIDAFVFKEGVKASAANTVTEMDATDAPGYYGLVLAQAETDALSLVVSATSSTAGVTLLPLGLASTTIDLSAGEVNTQVDTALADYDGPTKAELDAAQAAIEATTVPLLGPFTATGTPTITQATALVDAADDTAADYFPPEADAAANMLVLVRSGARRGVLRTITASRVSDGTLTLTFDAMPGAMEAGDTFVVGGLV